ncbi:MAG: extensin family protein [Pseudorhodobacter sp.]|nr:extensin family protein [Pseudorhodobacter sp.]
MRVALGLALVLCVLAGGAVAEGLGRSPRPQARPTAVAVPTLAFGPEAAAVLPLAAALRPRHRPAALAAGPAPVAAVLAQAGAVGLRPRARPEALVAAPVAQASLAPTGVLASWPRPQARPEVLIAASAPAPAPAKGWGLFRASSPRRLPDQQTALPRQGSVCGDRAIRGSELAQITSSTRGCGIAAPVRVTSVAGVALDPAPTLDCETAQALREWVDAGLQPAFGRNPVVGFQVAADYSCRTRNNKRGAKISEHGRGKAIDISGFVLADGSVRTVEDDWRGRSGKPIKAAYQSACGIFGTTLGPGSDGYHENHLHFDTASYRSGAYCR